MNKLEQWPHHSALQSDIKTLVKLALSEDIATGDISAALIPAQQIAQAQIITKEDCVFCGKAWAEAVFTAVDKTIEGNGKVYFGAPVMEARQKWKEMAYIRKLPEIIEKLGL